MWFIFKTVLLFPIELGTSFWKILFANPTLHYLSSGATFGYLFHFTFLKKEIEYDIPDIQ